MSANATDFRSPWLLSVPSDADHQTLFLKPSTLASVAVWTNTSLAAPPERIFFMLNFEKCQVKQPRPHLLRLRLGNAVWACRSCRRLSQTDLARKLKTSRQWISEVERGESLITTDSLLRLSKALGLRPEVLLRMGRL